MNTNGEPVTPSEIETHVAPSLLATASAEQISSGLVELQQNYGPFTLDPDSIVVTEDEPSTNLSYRMAGQDGTEFVVSLSIDPDTGLLTSYSITSSTQGATPVASPWPSGG